MKKSKRVISSIIPELAGGKVNIAHKRAYLSNNKYISKVCRWYLLDTATGKLSKYDPAYPKLKNNLTQYQLIGGELVVETANVVINSNSVFDHKTRNYRYKHITTVGATIYRTIIYMNKDGFEEYTSSNKHMYWKPKSKVNLEWKFRGYSLPDIGKREFGLHKIDPKLLFDQWNRIYPEWPLTYDKNMTWPPKVILKMFTRFYKNPALTLVYQELGARMTRVLGYYAYNTKQHSLDGMWGQPPYVKCFNFEATNVREFLNDASKGIYKWIKNSKMRGNRIAFLSYHASLEGWDFIRNAYDANDNGPWREMINTFKRADNINLLDELTRFKRKLDKRDLSRRDKRELMIVYLDYLQSQRNNGEELDINVHVNDIQRLHNEQIEAERLREQIRLEMNATQYQEYLKEQEILHKERNEKFIAINKEYTEKYEAEIDDYLFTFPKDHVDLSNEGRILRHCVGSYTDEVAKQQTVVVFQRKKNNPGKPHITVSLDPNFSVIYQQLRFSNREVNENAKKALRKWLKSINK